jgi:hypothetical protein
MTVWLGVVDALGGGVFILIQNHIIATEKLQYITKCELDWSKSILKTPKIY